jgi:DNA invertase Pin-like site-specific DNA recombinase
MEREGSCGVREHATLRQAHEGFIRERTNAGLKAARTRGRTGEGRNKLDAKRVTHAKALYADKTNTIEDICKMLRVSRTTLWRYVKGRGQPNQADPEHLLCRRSGQVAVNQMRR